MAMIYKCEQHGYNKMPYCCICGSKTQLCNHRTWLKILINPFLRLLGFHIVSMFTEQDEFIGYKVKKTH